ncbi:uncharacterized protein N7515_007221 [Penicillium bovifimosum]|uniref:Uncharacterized protein n=1 Tax=Penicillium bovifimosum TaxID=126998 RepID=A0A9W9GW86_9EURO|nr:uncharacterized protein N7515_007221 [Penicillium bovifimosum]KAJ5131182.1 hypothetical protein N7515_007221 [Penicillium bovifimosum]
MSTARISSELPVMTVRHSKVGDRDWDVMEKPYRNTPPQVKNGEMIKDIYRGAVESSEEV